MVSVVVVLFCVFVVSVSIGVLRGFYTGVSVEKCPWKYFGGKSIFTVSDGNLLAGCLSSCSSVSLNKNDNICWVLY